MTGKTAYGDGDALRAHWGGVGGAGAWGSGRPSEFRSQGSQALERPVILNIYPSVSEHY